MFDHERGEFFGDEADYGWEGEDDGRWDDDPSPYLGNYSED